MNYNGGATIGGGSIVDLKGSGYCRWVIGEGGDSAAMHFDGEKEGMKS